MNPKPGIRKIVSGGLAALVTWLGTQYIPGFNDAPAEVLAMIPALIGAVVFYFVPEKYEASHEEAQS